MKSTTTLPVSATLALLTGAASAQEMNSPAAPDRCGSNGPASACKDGDARKS